MIRALCFVRLATAVTAAVLSVGPDTGRSLGPSFRVGSWVPDIERVQREEGTDWDPAVILAVIHVESEGNPSARRVGSRFYGLTQVGPDVARETGTNRAAMVRPGRAGGRESIRAFVRWAARYEDLHDRDPVLMAVGWKGGVGTLKAYRARLQRGDRPTDVVQWLDRHRWGTWKYVRMFMAAYRIWSADDPYSLEPLEVK